jgi:K+-sensing histidine kinase KdpD
MAHWQFPNYIIFLTLSALILGALAVYAWRLFRYKLFNNEELEQRVEARAKELESEIIERQQIEAELQNSLKEMKIAYEQAIIYARELTEEITERKQAQLELKRSHGDLVALNTIITMVGQSRDLSHILTTMLDLVVVIVEAAGGYIQLLDEESGKPYLVAQKGLAPETIQAIEAIQSSCSLFLFKQSDLRHASQAKELSEVIKRAGWYPLIKIPLKCKDTVLGCMEILGRTSYELDKEQVKLLEAIGQQVGIAIENERLTKRAAETRVAQELDHLRSELISNVSHELRTPLGLIKAASTTLLRQDIEFDQEIRETLLHGIDEETDRLEHIVNNLLDLSRLEQKRLTLDRSTTDIGQLIRSVVESMQPQIQPDLQVEFDSPPQLLMANVDPKHVEQVLRNLLTNAIKYSPDGGTITIEVEQNKKELIVQFKDQGIGIPAADLKKIFERFYRVDNDITRDVSGAGLGLAISRELVEAHGGRMWAESEWGTGSTFYFTLPTKEGIRD